MDNDDHSVVSFVPVKNSRVRLPPGESKLGHESAYDFIPFSRCLFEAVDSFEKLEDIFAPVFLFVAWWLLPQGAGFNTIAYSILKVS